MGRAPPAAAGADLLDAPPAAAAPATSVEDAARRKAESLILTGLRTALPPGLKPLKHLRRLDLSQNTHLGLAFAARLPKSLVELHLTGCGLTELPAGLTSLTSLKTLLASGNALTSLGPCTRLPALQHLGLSYNPIAALPASLSACTSLLCLNLAHCDLHDLPAALESLTGLPRLQSLYLFGNPLALQPRYPSTVLRASWPTRLALLDGQRTEQLVGSRPSTNPASISSRPASHMASRSGTPSPAGMEESLGGVADRVKALGEVCTDTHIEMALGVLKVLEDPFESVKAAWAQDLAAQAAGSSPPTSLAPATPPLRPCFYHIQVDGLDGKPLELSLHHDQSLGSVTTTWVATRFDADQLEGSQQLGALGNEVSCDTPRTETAEPAGQADTQNATVRSTDVTPHTDLLASVRKAASLLQGTATQYCSVPLRIEPPVPPKSGQPDGAVDAAVPGTPKGKEDKGKGAKVDKAAAGKAGTKGTTGKGGSKPITPPVNTAEPECSLTRGMLKVVIAAAATVQTRDWLRRGIRVRLYRTEQRTPTTISATATLDSPNRGSTPNNAVTAAQPAENGDAADETVTVLAGEGVVPAAALLSAVEPHTVQTEVPILACPRLWDEQGRRMALKDTRHSREPIALLPARLLMHAMPAGESSPWPPTVPGGHL